MREKIGQAVVIKAGEKVFEAERKDRVTGKAIYDALPMWAAGQRWGVCKTSPAGQASGPNIWDERS